MGKLNVNNNAVKADAAVLSSTSVTSDIPVSSLHTVVASSNSNADQVTPSQASSTSQSSSSASFIPVIFDVKLVKSIQRSSQDFFICKKYIKNINSQDEKGNTLLHLAAHNSRKVVSLGIVKELLKLGADPNIQNMNGQTSLHIIAASTLRTTILTGIIKAFLQPRWQAKLDIEDNQRKTPLDIASEANNLKVFNVATLDASVTSRLSELSSPSLSIDSSSAMPHTSSASPSSADKGKQKVASKESERDKDSYTDVTYCNPLTGSTFSDYAQTALANTQPLLADGDAEEGSTRSLSDDTHSLFTQDDIGEYWNISEKDEDEQDEEGSREDTYQSASSSSSDGAKNIQPALHSGKEATSFANAKQLPHNGTHIENVKMPKEEDDENPNSDDDNGGNGASSSCVSSEFLQDEINEVFKADEPSNNDGEKELEVEIAYLIAKYGYSKENARTIDEHKNLLKASESTIQDFLDNCEALRRHAIEQERLKSLISKEVIPEISKSKPEIEITGVPSQTNESYHLPAKSCTTILPADELHSVDIEVGYAKLAGCHHTFSA